MAALMVATVAVTSSSAGADVQGTARTQSQCLEQTNASVTLQYDAKPIPGMTLTQVLNYFDANSQCGTSQVSAGSVGNPPVSGVQPLAGTQYKTASLQVCSWECIPYIDNFIIQYQGTWSYNGSLAQGTGQVCSTRSTAPTVSVTWDECNWVYKGGVGLPNSYALMRARWHQTITILWIQTSYYYWYWLNAYTNGTYLFGCNEC